ncbi:MAG: aspartate aminotransferase family protein [Candidatus Thorarchaeota archaeon]
MLERYKAATQKSAKLWDRALRVFAGGVNHNIRTFGLDKCGAYPPFIAKGEGCHIWDVDGNEYIDFWMTHYAQILGHNNPAVGKALRRQLENGIHFGGMGESQVVLAEKMQSAVPMLRKMRFCTTGSESTMYATRLARLFTKKPLVAKARGGWHGGNDSLGYHLKYPFTDDPFFEGVSFDYNDTASFDQMLAKNKDDLAAVIIEPVLGAGGGLPPEPEFLPHLREQTERHGILLIFDEIITGFRICYGSAGVNVFGVEPDLITLGKIAGGGMPLGVYGGREDIMALAKPGAEASRWVGGGTFSSHPLTMATGIAALGELHKLRNEYQKLNQRGDAFRSRINTLFSDNGFIALATGTGSIVFINALKNMIQPPYTAQKIGEAFDSNRLDRFQGTIMEEGVFGYHGLGALSFSHSTRDLDRTIDAIEVAVKAIRN